MEYFYIYIYRFIGLQESRKVHKSASMDVVDDDSHHFQVTNLSINNMNPMGQPSSSKVKLPHSPVLPTHLDRGPVPVFHPKFIKIPFGPARLWWITAKLENKHMKQRGKTNITNIHQDFAATNREDFTNENGKISIGYSKQPGKQPFFMGKKWRARRVTICDHQERGGKPTAHHRIKGAKCS